jgi:DNA-directed RNA polymerase sigma subunit (sigma70/sigma32)
MKRYRNTATQMAIWRGEVMWEEIPRLKNLKERWVLMTRSGAFGGDIWTLRQLAEWFMLTPERIRQIENRAIRWCQYDCKKKFIKKSN